MTFFSRHIAYLVGITVFAGVESGAGHRLYGADSSWSNATHRLTDSTASDTPHLASPEPARPASYRMTDHASGSNDPRVPSELLRELRNTVVQNPHAPNAGHIDAGHIDAGHIDAGPIDAGPIDAAAGGSPAVTDSQPGLIRVLPPVEPQAIALGPPDVTQPKRPAFQNTCNTCGSSPLACECRYRAGREGLFENTQVFLAGDGWKNIFDDDDNNNFGFRTGFNMGLDLPGDRAVRGQLGMSYGAYDFAGREELLSRDDPVEQQVFATAGLYKRSVVECEDRWAWGAVYDLLVADEAGERADSLRLAQVRSYLGYALNESDEIGVWSAFRLMRDYAPAQRVMVNPTDQANLFWHRRWQLGGDTTTYVGWADDPGSVVLGLDGRVPLNPRTALFGRVHYIIASTRGGDVHPTLGIDDVFTQESWNISFGIIFYRGAKAVSPNVSGVFGLPLLDVADNGTFSYQSSNL